VGWRTARPTGRHVGGAVLFGLGWAVANTCPGPVVAQVSTGVWWSGFTFAGVVLGIKLYALRHAPRVAAAGTVRAAPQDGPLPSSLELPATYQMAASVSGSKK
jgi:uncharacterized protein